jgi:hypothetical protein
MADERWFPVQGILVQGHRVASGPSRDYPYGSLSRQFPLFLARGLDLRGCFQGTLNISIAPRRWDWIRPQFTFRAVTWTDLHPSEDFSFSACQVRTQQAVQDGWVYYPHPETKRRNFQDPGLIEVICPWIGELGYGDAIELLLDRQAIRVHG